MFIGHQTRMYFFGLSLLLAGVAFVIVCNPQAGTASGKNIGRDPRPGVKITDDGKFHPVQGLAIRVHDFKDVFLRNKEGIRYSRTMFRLSVRYKKSKSEYDAWSGFKTNFSSYSLRVLDCATGTRDWKSFAKLQVQKTRP